MSENFTTNRNFLYENSFYSESFFTVIIVLKNIPVLANNGECADNSSKINQNESVGTLRNNSDTYIQ